MKQFIFISMLIAPAVSFAQQPHREHGAHHHGSAEASIAFDGTKGSFEFKSPSDSIMGFEHVAKTAADKKALDDAMKTFELRIADMVSFDSKLGCQFTKQKLAVEKEAAENHSDTVANFSILCTKSPLGSTLTLNFQKFFPKLHDVDLQILVDTLQKSFEAKASGTQVELR